MKKKTLEFCKVLSFFCFVFLTSIQISHSQNYIWEQVSNFSKANLNKSKINASVYNLRVHDFEQKLNNVSSNNSVLLSFPRGDGSSADFLVYETKVMHPVLAAKFSEIKSYRGISKDDSNKVLVFTYSKKAGFYGVFESGVYEKTEIKPLSNSFYEFSKTTSQEGDSAFSCETEDYVKKEFLKTGVFDRDINDGNLRRYRLALSVSGDYSQVFLDGTEADDIERKTKVLQAMVGSINRLNGIFERDFGVTMQLIANSDLLIFLDPLTDPYSSGNSLRNQLVNTINSTVTNDDYDVGHLFHQELNRKYGNAGCIACVCTNGAKGQAYSVHSEPDSDDMNLLAAHEFGHQFGAYHTQSSSNCRSGVNSEVEPGSGSTIMSYAGICPPNVQAGSDDYFNYTSIRDVAEWTINNSSCAELIATNNSAPIIDRGSDYIIPKSTPFVLEGGASDADGNEALTYCWEQNDPENPGGTNTPQPTNTAGPMFRSLPPTSSNKRYFPSLDDVLVNNLTPTWEVLPSVSRQLNFVMTVRDNDVNGGQTVSDAIVLDVINSAGPFEVTTQTDNAEVWTVGDLVTVSWNVANTSLAPISTSQVQILLSTDGGQTFPTNLAITDNDGTETFNLPNVDATADARIMVKAVGNVFFAVNQQGFTIQKSDYVILSAENHINVCDNENAVFNLEYKTFLTFDEEVTASASNLPTGTNATFSQDTFNGTNIEGSPFLVTLSGLETLEPGDYSFNVEGESVSNIRKNIDLSFTVFSANDVVLNLVSPVDEANSQELDLELVWDKDENSVSYQVEVATDDTFNNIVEDAGTIETAFSPTSLETNQVYYWRVQSLSPCGTSDFSETYSFSTMCSPPMNLSVVATEINSIEVAWEDSSSSTSWTIEYGVSGFLVGTGTSSTESGKQLKVEGLESGTKYDFYVSGNCSIGGSSSLIGPLAVHTDSDYCGGDHFYDSGGADNNYSDNENIITQIYPESDSERVRVRFDAFNVHPGNDFLRIYNGESDAAPLLGSFTGTQLIGQELVSTNDSGALTFVFTSNSFLNFSGWDAVVTCEEKPNCFEPINFQTASLKGDEASFTWEAVGDDSNWEIEYGLTGFIKGSGITVTATEAFATIENLIPLTSYDIYIKTICDAGGYSEVLGPYRIVTTELCSTPSDLNVTSFTNDMATITWENLNSDVSAWQVEYGLNGFTLGSGTTQDLTEKTITLNSLISNSDYQVYVRSNCEADGDGYSNWAGPVSFTTTPDYCSGDHFYDSGGLNGNYSNSENSVTTIHPKTLDERIRVQFNSFLVETCCDRLMIYDGPNTESPLIGSFRSNPGILMSSHESGALTFLFVSDASVTSMGWDATVICEDKPNCLAPTSFAASNVESRQVDLSWQQSDNEMNWTIEYGLIGFTSGEGTEVLSNSTNKIITGLTPDTVYEAYLKANCSAGGFSDVVGPIRFTTPVACFVPQNLHTTSVSSTTANVTWDASISGETEWAVEYGNRGFLLGTGTNVSQSINSVLIENLESNTEYDIYVRANCDTDGFSNWSFVSTFRTDCDVILGAYKESFVETNIRPDCWSQSDNGGWNFNKYASYGAANVQDRSSLNNSNYAWLDGSLSAFNGDYILKSPWVDISTLANPAITFSVFSKNTINEVYNTLNVTLYDSDGVSFSNIITVNNDTSIWRDFVIDLSNYAFTSSEIQIEFKVTLNSGSSSKRYNDILIDEVSFGELPNCTNPINPVVRNITGRTAELAWESTDDETNWEIQYGFSGFTVSGATTIFTSENPYTFTNLMPERSYDAYIRAVCGIGDSSEFIGPITFSTTELCLTPTNFQYNSVTKNSAQLAWDDVDGAEWEVEYAIGYFSPGNGTAINTTDNHLDLESLLPDTTYYAYLRRDCGDEDGYSYWTRYIVFRTQVACEVPTGFRTAEVTKNSASFYWDDSDDNLEWEVEYNIGYFVPGNGIGTRQVTSTNNIVIENLLPENRYYIYLRSNCGNEDGYSNWTSYRVFTTPVACISPFNFNVSDITKNSASVNWVNNSSATEWEVEYNIGYFNPGNGIGTTQIVNSNSINLQNLEPLSTYYVYVRSNCGDDGYSQWGGYVSFTTLLSCSTPTNFRVISSTQNTAALAWDEDESVFNWEFEYSQNPFSPGLGTRTIVQSPGIDLENLQSNTTYYAYVRSDCDDEGYSNWSNQITFSTLCDLQPTEDDLILNGGFECGSIAGWILGGPNVFSGCSYNFTALSNSGSVCTIVNDINPEDGVYAVYTSFDGSANTIYSLSQSIDVPANIANSTSAMLSFDFKVNYKMTFNNPTQERVFEVRFTDVDGIQLFKVDELKFGLNPNEGGIEISFSENILSELSNYAGQTVLLNFQAFVPESSTGPAKAMLDNVSLIVDEVLSNSNKNFKDNKLLVYPIPNKGRFTLNNLNGGLIELIEIFDVSGRLIQTEKVSTPSQKINVHMQHITSGVYFVKVLIHGNKYIKRIVVE